MTDYTFMKTGLVAPPDESKALDNTVRQYMSVSLAMIGRAATSAATYATHAGRSSVTQKDIALAMQYQSKVFFDHVTDEEVAEARQDVDDAMDSESEDSEDAESDEDSSVSDDDKDPWTRSVCACVVCAGTNDAHDTWTDWNPTDHALVTMKRATDKFLATVSM